MTLVNAETGEVLSEITADDARTLTDQIKVTVDGAWMLIQQAWQTRAWAALGYSSWDDYMTREFGTSRLRLPREERQEVTISMRELGMSTRAIASATGGSEATVRRSLAGASNDAPAPVAPRPITGTDGKTYQPSQASPNPKPAPTAPRRSPLGDQVRSAGWDLRKSVERLERLAADDRFSAQRDQMAAHLRGHLTNAISVCQDLLDGLTNEPTEAR